MATQVIHLLFNLNLVKIGFLFVNKTNSQYNTPTQKKEANQNFDWPLCLLFSVSYCLTTLLKKLPSFVARFNK